MCHFYVFLSSKIQNCISGLEQISHFVFYIISFILSGETRLYKLSYIYSLSQSKIESTPSSFISFHLCAFCIVYCLEHHLTCFTCALHHLPPSSVAPGHKLTATAARAACHSSLPFRASNKQIYLHPHCTVIIYVYLLYIHRNAYCTHFSIDIQPQIRKSWDSMENANKKRK